MGGSDADPARSNDGLDPDYEPSEKEMLEYAEWLGIDAERDPELLWIARRGLKTPLPKPWKPCESDDGEVFYFNPQTGQTTWDHPCDQELREIYRKEVAKKNGDLIEDEAVKEDAGEKIDKKQKKDKKSKKSVAPRPPPAPLAPTSSGTGSLSNALPGPLAGLLGPLPPLSLPRSSSGGSLPGVPPVAEPPAPSSEREKETLSDDGDLDDLFDLPLQLGGSAKSPSAAAAAESSAKVPAKTVPSQSQGMLICDSDVSIIEESLIQGGGEDIAAPAPPENNGTANEVAKVGATPLPPAQSTNAPNEEDNEAVVEPFCNSMSSEELPLPPMSKSASHREVEEPPKVGLGGVTPRDHREPDDVANQHELSPMNDSIKSDSLGLSGALDLGVPNDAPSDTALQKIDTDPVAKETSLRNEMPPESTTSPVSSSVGACPGTSSCTADAVSDALAAAAEKHNKERCATRNEQEALLAAATKSYKSEQDALRAEHESLCAATARKHKAEQDALRAEHEALRSELKQACEARDHNLSSLNDAQAERDRLREGASSMTNAIAEVRRQKCLEEQRTRDASEECEQLRTRLAQLEVDLAARGRADTELRQLREEHGAQVKHANERQAAATALADKLQEELRCAREELSVERASTAARDQEQKAGHSSSSSKGMSLGPRSRLEFESPSPPTPQLASILVAELRPDEQISLWSPEEAPTSKSGPGCRAAEVDANNRKKPTWPAAKGHGVVDNISGSGSLELSSLSAVLEQSNYDFGDGSMMDELHFPRERKDESPARSKGNNSTGNTEAAKQAPQQQVSQQQMPKQQVSQQQPHLQCQGPQHMIAAPSAKCAASNAPTAQPSPATTLETDALTNAFSTIRLHKTPAIVSPRADCERKEVTCTDGATQAKRLHSELHEALVGGAASLENDAIAAKCDHANAAIDGRTVPIAKTRFSVGGNMPIDGADKQKHMNDDLIYCVTSTPKCAIATQDIWAREAQNLRGELTNCEMQLNEACSDLQREKASHLATQASMRERTRETAAMKGQLEGKDAEVKRTLAETQRCHDEIASKDVELHQLRLQLQAREAELGQLRSQWRVQCQQSDAALQRQRFELGEREQALLDRERFLDERERLSGEVEIALHKQRRELQAKLHSIELGSLREVAAPLSVGVMPADTKIKARHDISGKDSCDVPRSRSCAANGDRIASSRGRRSASSDGRAIAAGSSDDSFAPRSRIPCNEAKARRSSGATPSSVASHLSPLAAACEDAADSLGTPFASSEKASPAAITDLGHSGKRTVRELAEVLRGRRQELRSEHAALEEDRKRWREEVRQLRSGSISGRCDGRGGVAASQGSLPRSCATARAALDERAAELNKAIDEHRALERSLAGRLKHDRGASPHPRSSTAAIACAGGSGASELRAPDSARGGAAPTSVGLGRVSSSPDTAAVAGGVGGGGCQDRLCSKGSSSGSGSSQQTRSSMRGEASRAHTGGA
eukprot:TRINITY_DN13644_c1_g2_i8.p1 TRINITY_DN13644_c1_g2~~TRINITY_DN13644_c1_g2_i8.p1  ORF type:complete len:1478 (+),score=258.68 TRINITY_DN13644_c1_g2_i8:94-4527(+)